MPGDGAGVLGVRRKGSGGRVGRAGDCGWGLAFIPAAASHERKPREVG